MGSNTTLPDTRPVLLWGGDGSDCDLRLLLYDAQRGEYAPHGCVVELVSTAMATTVLSPDGDVLNSWGPAIGLPQSARAIAHELLRWADGQEGGG